jgi:transcriptional regulator with XRE-family HTH domain
MKPLPKPEGLSVALARVIRAHLAVREEQLTQAQIGERVGVSQSLVSSLLLGRRDFPMQIVIGFADLLGLRPHELLHQAERLLADEPLDQILTMNNRREANGTLA